MCIVVIKSTVCTFLKNLEMKNHPVPQISRTLKYSELSGHTTLILTLYSQDQLETRVCHFHILPHAKLLEFRYEMSHKRNVQALVTVEMLISPTAQHQNIEANYFYVLGMLKAFFSLGAAFKIIKAVWVHF